MTCLKESQIQARWTNFVLDQQTRQARLLENIILKGFNDIDEVFAQLNSILDSYSSILVLIELLCQELVEVSITCELWISLRWFHSVVEILDNGADYLEFLLIGFGLHILHLDKGIDITTDFLELGREFGF